MPGAVRVYHFRCPDCGERKARTVAVTDAAVEPTVGEICTNGHVRELERTEER